MKKRKSNNMNAAQFRARHVDQLESKLQRLFVRWFRLQYPKLLLYAIPNGGLRSKIEAAIMQGEGVTTGIPDLFLAYPSNGFHGLYIEMKTVNGSPSDEQLIIHAYLRAVGYEVIMPRTFEEAQTQVNQYLHP